MRNLMLWVLRLKELLVHLLKQLVGLTVENVG